MRKRYRVFLIIDAILLFFALGILFSYERYLAKKKNEPSREAIVISNGPLSINYLDGQVISFSDFRSPQTHSFSVTNTGSESIYYSINILNTNNPYGDHLTLSLKSTNGGANITSMTYPNEDYILPSYILIKPNVTQSYVVTLSYQGSLSALTDTVVEGSILIGKEKSKDNTFASVLLDHHPVQNYKTKPGEEIATEDEGLIMSEDDHGKIYYFRGAVKDNYVSLADQLWRVVRINSDGTIRLILNDVIESSTQMYNSKDLSDVVIERVSHFDYKNSDVKNYLDSWYEEYLTDYDDYIADGSFCVDLSAKDSEDEKNYIFHSYDRAQNTKTPTYACKDYEETHKIGLLSSDEAMFAGASVSKSNNSYYLYNNKISAPWWLSSPGKTNLTRNLSMIAIRGNGSIDANCDQDSYNYVRPVINLSKNVVMTGTGTLQDPYHIK